jgi:hypothetical protein
MSDKQLELLFNLTALFAMILVMSFFLSLINAITASSPCKTNGYYLPLTYVICNMNEERK